MIESIAVLLCAFVLASPAAAAGANLIGYGSGAVLFILDTLGAFDYALVRRRRGW